MEKRSIDGRNARPSKRNDIIGSCHFHVGSCVGISDEHINDPNCKPFW